MNDIYNVAKPAYRHPASTSSTRQVALQQAINRDVASLHHNVSADSETSPSMLVQTSLADAIPKQRLRNKSTAAPRYSTSWPTLSPFFSPLYPQLARHCPRFAFTPVLHNEDSDHRGRGFSWTSRVSGISLWRSDAVGTDVTHLPQPLHVHNDCYQRGQSAALLWLRGFFNRCTDTTPISVLTVPFSWRVASTKTNTRCQNHLRAFHSRSPPTAQSNQTAAIVCAQRHPVVLGGTVPL